MSSAHFWASAAWRNTLPRNTEQFLTQALQSGLFRQRLRLANIFQRTLPAARIVHRRRKFARGQHRANGVGGFDHQPLEFRRDVHLAPPVTACVKNRAFGHGAIQHFFQAHRLRGELDVIMQFLPLGAVFELDGVHTAVWMELD